VHHGLPVEQRGAVHGAVPGAQRVGPDHRQLLVIVGGRGAAYADRADHVAVADDRDAALERHGPREV